MIGDKGNDNPLKHILDLDFRYDLDIPSHISVEIRCSLLQEI